MSDIPMTMSEWCDHVWMRALDGYAHLHYDGHWTVLRFTTNVRVMVGTPNDREDIDNAFEGCSISDAIEKLLWHHARIEVFGKMQRDRAAAYVTGSNQMIGKYRGRCRTS